MAPLYEFQCTSCNHVFESVMKPWDDVECPKCKVKKVKRLITAHGGYTIKGDNGASVKPRSSGSFKRKERKDE